MHAPGLRPHVRRFAVPLVAAGLLLAACGGGSKSSSGGGGSEAASACPVKALDSAKGPVTITFWHAMNEANSPTLKKLTDEYNASQDKVRVKLVFTGSYKETLDKYLATLRGGVLPQIVQLEETTQQLMIDSKSAVPAEACVKAANYDTSDFLPSVLDEFTVQGQLWPMPFNVSNPVLYYSKVAFQKAGLDPDKPPATLAELRAASEKIVQSGAAKHGLVLTEEAWYFEQWMTKAGQAIVDQSNGRDGRATKATIDNAAGKDIFGWIHDMVADKLAYDIGPNPSGRDHLLAVATGDAAMTIGTSAALGGVYDFLKAAPDLQAKVGLGVGPFPGDTKGSSTAGGAALWLVKKSTDAQKAAAWDYMTWLDQPEHMAIWHAGTGYIPITKSAAEQPAVQALWKERPGFKVAYDQLAEASRKGPSGPVIGAYSEFRDAIVNGIQRMAQQGQSADTALTATEKAATAAMQSYNQRVG